MAFQGKFQSAESVIRSLQQLVQEYDGAGGSEILRAIANRTNLLQSQAPHDIVIGNIGRRCEMLVRNKYKQHLNGTRPTRILLFEEPDEKEPDIRSADAHRIAMEELTKFEEKIKRLGSAGGICHGFISPGDTIVTVSYGVQVFNHFVALRQKGVEFSVLIPENEPLRDGKALALTLAKSNIQTALISDASIALHLMKASCVLLEPELILVNGGAIATSGAVLTAMTARAIGRPVYCLCEIFQFCAEHINSVSHLLASSHPCDVLPAESMKESFSSFKNLTIKAPLWAYMEPDLVTAYITSEGTFQPSSIFQLAQPAPSRVDFV